MKVPATLALFATATARAAYPTYDIPAFDVQVGSEASSLVAALKSTGLVALKNIPDYSTTRTAYMQAAAECVTAPHENVIHKRLVDGTQRRTLSTHADLDLVPESLTNACPDYVAALKAFNRVIDKAGVAFARALDATSTSIQNHAVETVVTKGKNLEHLHAYASSAVSSPDSELSLERHTDNGLFILMSAPKFFDAASNQPVDNPDANAGLLVTLNGTDFRPVQKDDELVVMVGQAFNEWGDFGHRLPAVLHAMVMPRSATPVNRIFFGRMVLLPEDAVMANTNTTFSEYAASTKRFLLGQDNDVATFACPIHRQLQSSDPSCTIGIWEPSADSAGNVTKAMCMRDCNVDASVAHMKKDFDRCLANKCIKTSEVANGGTTCWMVCVQKYSDDVCPSKSSTCVDDTLVCQGGTVPPKAGTSAPTTTSKSAAATSLLSAAVACVVVLAGSVAV
ncbi:hypothetical protein H257_07580 [Aphanomyces astaci]|uniref:Fe2OG dioxygenase domain-containing protein n=1 Tax=Aphanomyces astaci TaxID=112090 RepID=W4GGB8_APHAT|nr:hypothetical protein H257_07580 [Aphanomyces astaci]ETV78737.1 hypothetical protein H257_07580 [Aphanomyces astaci]|eukprot:XP_009831456.1 hypothetical protein H257_07580 [Aphanomyces astaci]